MALNEIFIIGSRKKNNNTNNNYYNSNGYNLRNYVKKGTIKENAIDELYKKTTLKLGDDYRNRLSTLLYRENHVKDYFNKRINLDNIIYEYDDEKKLYITLTKFKNNNSGQKNNSFQNLTENMSKFMTNDTNNYNGNENNKNENKDKLKVKDLLDKFKEERMKIEIKKLLLNEEKEMPKYLEREIFDQLSKKYNFVKYGKNSPKNISSIYTNKSSFSNSNSFFPKSEKNFGSVNLIKEKTNQLNMLKSKKYTNYLTPIFFLGKNRDKFINRISYASHKKFRKEKIERNTKDIKEGNIKYLNIMEKDINELHDININNKKIMTES